MYPAEMGALSMVVLDFAAKPPETTTRLTWYSFGSSFFSGQLGKGEMAEVSSSSESSFHERNSKMNHSRKGPEPFLRFQARDLAKDEVYPVNPPKSTAAPAIGAKYFFSTKGGTFPSSPQLQKSPRSSATNLSFVVFDEKPPIPIRRKLGSGSAQGLQWTHHGTGQRFF